jgi:plastocyanin
MSSRPDLVAGVRLRVPLIIAIPIGALVVIGGAAYGFSRVLLALEPEAATAVALMMAVNVLIACAVVAYKPRLDAVTLAELVVVMTYPIVIGIVLAQIGFGETAGHHDTQTAAAQATGLQLAASNAAFDTKELDFKAGEETVLPFNNEDSLAHNFSIYEDDSATKDLFKGAEVPGGSSTDYDIPSLDKGEYFFRCDLHPSMNGAVVVE